jgi:hypothetical protein
LFLLAGALLCVIASCVESRHPLSDQNTSKIDERLIGTWLCEGDTKGWQVKKSSQMENAMEVTMPGPQASGKFSLFSTTVKSNQYMSVTDWGADAKTAPGGAGFSIYQYAFLDKDTVQLRGMEQKVIEKAIADNALGGETRIERGRFLIFSTKTRRPIVTAPPEAIVRYLEAHADECYPAKTDAALTWKRQK